MNKINTYLIINPFAVGFLIIALAIGYYFIFALPKQSNTDNSGLTPTVDTAKYYQQAELDSCLEIAEKNFATTFELNSYPAPQEGYPDARRWNDASIKERTEDNLRKDKEICIQLYK